MSIVIPNNNNQHSTLSTTTLSGGNSGIVYKIEQEKLILYIDLMAQLLGININFENFLEMTPEEIKSFTRDLKLKKLID